MCVHGVDGEFKSYSLKVDNPRTKIDKIVDSSGSEIDTTNIEMLKIRTGKKTVKFVPAGIKKKFPDLKVFTIENSGLTHLEREDMRQFGADLGFVSFSENSLTALPGNLLEFNPNVKYIYIRQNPLKYIDGALFQHFKSMEKLRTVNFEHCNCISKESDSPKTFEWNSNQRCNDEEAKQENFNMIDQRKAFFQTIFN